MVVIVASKGPLLNYSRCQSSIFMSHFPGTKGESVSSSEP